MCTRGVLAAALVLALAVLPGCGAGAPAPAGPVVRDSAGVRIVENRGFAWAAPGAWRVSADPVVVIGRTDLASHDPAYEFHGINGATRLGDGRIVVSNWGSSEIRFYASDGRHLRSVGRRGDGPGEFRSLVGVHRFRGDSILGWDSDLRRFSIFAGDGGFARSARPEPSGANPDVAGVFGDGSILIRDARYELQLDRAHQQQATFVRHGPGGEALDSLGLFPMFVTVPVRSPGGQPTIGGLIFGPRLVHAVSGRRLYLGEGRDHEVAVRDMGGRLLERIRWEGERRAVQRIDIEADRERRLSAASSEAERRAMAARLEDASYAEALPAYDGLFVDPAGRIWAGQVPRPSREERDRWTVIDPDGRLLGEVAAPLRMRILEIGEDYLLGVHYDDFDVETLRLHEIVRPSR